VNSLRVRIFLSCVPAIFATGCDPIDPCADVTCDPNEVCFNGTCETVCDGDDDCAAGEICFNAVCAANCIVNDDCACDGDADCNDQDACTTDLCAGDDCVNTPISCNTAATCPAGCNVSCNALFFCSNSVDPCANVTCDPDEVCVDGACIECFSDADCDGGEVCFNNGRCVDCVSDADCDAGEVCDEPTNTCVECFFNNDCDDQNACTADTCVDQKCLNTELTCNVDADCPGQCMCILIAGSGVCITR